MAERLLILIEELDVGPAYVASHSTGGATALAAAVRDFGSIGGLVLSNTEPNLKQWWKAKSHTKQHYAGYVPWRASDLARGVVYCPTV